MKGMGFSRRKEARDIAEDIEESNRKIAGVTLSQVCAGGAVMLEVACHRCSRRGRYRVTGLIDRHGVTFELVNLKGVLAADCPKGHIESYFSRCGVYFPGVNADSRS